MKSISILFGAGAESFYNIPLGSKYTEETVLRKRTKLYENLENFYNDIEIYYKDYVGKYEKQFRFAKNSSSFKTIIIRALVKASKLDDKDIDPQTLKLINRFNVRYIENIDQKTDDDLRTILNPDKESDFDKLVEGELYNQIIEDDKESIFCKREVEEGKALVSNVAKEYQTIRSHLEYYGEIEKDFSVIINPFSTSNVRFWRLVNYFWSAFYVICQPLTNWIESNYRENNDPHNYKYANSLSGLVEILKTIYEFDYFSKETKISQEGKSKEKNSSYYYQIRALLKNEKNFNLQSVATTNYTPMLRSYFKDILSKENICYLAGELNLFENPYELRVLDICKEQMNTPKLVFPFMLTQAPVKPIIEPRNIGEYANFIKALANTDILCIVGYNINPNDNHINSIIRDYLCNAINTEAKLMVFNYDKSQSVSEITSIPKEPQNLVQVKNDIIKKLRLENDIETSKIIVVNFSGKNGELEEHLMRVSE